MNVFDPVAYQSKGLAISEFHSLSLSASGGTANFNIATGTTIYRTETQVSVVCTPDTGNTFLRWKEYPNVTIPEISVTLSEDITLTALLSPTRTLEIQIIGDGTSNGVTDGTYGKNELLKLQVRPDDGWNFDFWSINSNSITTRSNPYIYKIVDNTVAKAVLMKKSYKLRYANSSGGSLSASPAYAYHGDVVQLEAIPEEGYSFKSWMYDLSGSTDNPVEFTVLDNATIGAEFEQSTFTITTEITGDGEIIVSPDKESYVYGEYVEITAVPDIGNSFSEWTGNLVGDDPTKQLKIYRNLDIGATFLTDTV